MKLAVALAAAAVALTALSGSARADTGLNAANALTAAPWNALAAQYTQDTLASISALTGKRITHLHGSGWHFDVHLQNMSGSLNVSSPPGFAAASPADFAVAAPLNGGWSLRISGNAHGDGSACCTPAGQNWFSVKGDVPFALSLSNIRLTASTRLGTADPTRPTLASAQLAATARVGGSGIFPGVPVTLAATIANGAVILGGDLVSSGFSLGGVSAHLTVHVQLKIVRGYDQEELEIGKTLNLSYAVQNSELSVTGSLSVRLPDPIKTKTGTLGIEMPFHFPTTRSLDDAIAALNPPLPRLWPPPNALNRPDGHAQPSSATGADFAAARDALENGIPAHLPNGTVLSIDSSPLRLGQTYGLENDSMIWTGHYLAAEAFRYAATASPEAVARVQTLLDGIRKNFAVTTDGVVVDGRPSVVDAGRYAGIFARSSLPDDGTAHYTDGDLAKRKGACYYVRSEQGWHVGRTTYKTLALALPHATKISPPKPVGTASYGWGCGDRGETDHPVSRDQYLGLFMGLGYAYALIPDTAVRETIRTITDSALGYLLRNSWNVPLPPSGRIVTTFIGDIDAQLALLRIGATIDEARFGAAYQAAAPATDLSWIPIWFSTIDPPLAYYKFNLGHASVGTAAFLETTPALKAAWLRSYRILAAPTATHRNAYFNLVDLLTGAATAGSASASNPAMTRSAEIKSDLADWLTRWKLVKGANGMPRNATSATAAGYLAGLWTAPQVVTSYTDTNGTDAWLTTFVVPLWARPGNGMDFVWQRSPFGAGVDGPASKRTASNPITRASYTCGATPPSSAQLAACSAEATREGPGIDFLLPYWLGRYLNVLPG